jgi:hypothetical protein
VVAKKPHTSQACIHERLVFSVSRIDPSLTPDQIANMSQKDQMIMILDTLKKTESIPYVVKVGLYVNDMA